MRIKLRTKKPAALFALALELDSTLNAPLFFW